jgi:hypothetical protein
MKKIIYISSGFVILAGTACGLLMHFCKHKSQPQEDEQEDLDMPEDIAQQ